jgi:phosphoribosylformylglycinamidine cyclo-ligase
VVEKTRVIDGRRIAPGDVVLGLASSGAHSNGYSLVRRILERAKPDLAANLDGRPLADALLAPTRIYVKPVLALLQEVPVKGIAHITGGGLVENISRACCLKGVRARRRRARAWLPPPPFPLVAGAGQRGGRRDARLNCGSGWQAPVVATATPRARSSDRRAAGETVHRIGMIERCSDGSLGTVVAV